MAHLGISTGAKEYMDVKSKKRAWNGVDIIRGRENEKSQILETSNKWREGTEVLWFRLKIGMPHWYPMVFRKSWHLHGFLSFLRCFPLFFAPHIAGIPHPVASFRTSTEWCSCMCKCKAFSLMGATNYNVITWKKCWWIMASNWPTSGFSYHVGNHGAMVAKIIKHIITGKTI